jgi:uncharacterized protein with GYD domain
MGAMIEQQGGKLYHFFFTLGDYNMVALGEFPDQKTPMAVSLTVNATIKLRHDLLASVTATGAARLIAIT